MSFAPNIYRAKNNDNKLKRKKYIYIFLHLYKFHELKNIFNYK